jgi:hypothetical protein
VFILLPLITFPSCQILKSVPDELIGTWTTESHEYNGIFLELGQKTILFGKKDGSVDRFNIVRIKRNKQKGEWVRYTIFYRNYQMNMFEFPILYHPHNSGTVRFVNNEQYCWSRKS